ncbi:MAG: hypothetical protein KDI46_01375 [Alphaproteobacteria bacterium]|nr:hypothetical protein [Alphaproteobacteria bacterium]
MAGIQTWLNAGNAFRETDAAKYLGAKNAVWFVDPATNHIKVMADVKTLKAAQRKTTTRLELV